MAKPNFPNTNTITPEDAAALLKPPSVGRMLAVTPRYVLILAERGDLACVRIGAKAVRFRREDVDAFVAARHHPATLAINEKGGQ